MGEFILLMAQETSARQGISAEGIFRHGSVAEEVIGLCQELETNYLMLGKPQVEREDTVFTQDRLHEFVARTEEQTGATVVFPEEDAQ
jgi:hypothetical protein